LKTENFDILDEVVNSMIITIIGHSLELNNVNKKLDPKKVFEALNSTQLNTYKEFV
jgi:hypothetical protein